MALNEALYFYSHGGDPRPGDLATLHWMLGRLAVTQRQLRKAERVLALP